MKTLFALHQPWECEIWPGYDPFVAQCLSKFDVAVEPTSDIGRCASDHLRGGGAWWRPRGAISGAQLVSLVSQGPGGCWTNLVMVLTPPGVTRLRAGHPGSLDGSDTLTWD